MTTIQVSAYEPSLYDGKRIVTHPIAHIETDGTPQNTTVQLELADGSRLDVTPRCVWSLKKENDPRVWMTLCVLAPQDQMDRSFDVRVDHEAFSAAVAEFTNAG